MLLETLLFHLSIILLSLICAQKDKQGFGYISVSF